MYRSSENRENILGVDYGDVNTGLAIATDGVSVPLKVVKSLNIPYLIQEINRVVVEYKIKLMVFGLPLDHNGQDTKQSIKVRQVVNQIKKYIKVPINYVSEFGTTKEALSSGFLSQASRKSKSRNNDTRSACMILDRYLESEDYKKEKN